MRTLLVIFAAVMAIGAYFISSAGAAEPLPAANAHAVPNPPLVKLPFAFPDP
jgi:hypothetical protein